MEHRTTQRDRFARAVALALAAAALATAPARAELPAFGMVQLSARQSAVMHAVLTHTPSADHPGCWITASFVDAMGNTFKDATGKEITAKWLLKDNVAQSLTVQASDILGTQTRKLIRAAVHETPDAGAESNCCALTLTLEIRNANGSTRAAAGPRGPPAEPDLCRPLPAN